MNIETLKDAFIYEISDMQDSEKQLSEALPKMAEAASNPELRQALEDHKSETDEQRNWLGQVIEICQIEVEEEKCEAMEGLVKEGEEIIQEVEEGPVRDALIIAAAQKAEHYEIASYGTLVALAKEMEYEEAANLLHKILEQEKAIDKRLTELAESRINEQAMQRAA